MVLSQKEVTYVYKYEEKGGELFGVAEEMTGYDYELASIRALDKIESWGAFVRVKEGFYKWNGNGYSKIIGND